MSAAIKPDRTTDPVPSSARLLRLYRRIWFRQRAARLRRQATTWRTQSRSPWRHPACPLHMADPAIDLSLDQRLLEGDGCGSTTHDRSR